MDQDFIIDKRIRNLSEDQIKLMKEVWETFLKTKEWPKGLLFRKKHSRTSVEGLLKDLSPIFISSTSYDPRENHYRLSPQGVYAVEGLNGPSIQLILRYLDHIKKRFDEDPRFDQLTAKELEAVLKLNREETRVLGELFDLSTSTFPRLWGRSASNLRSSDWTVGIIDEIESLYESKNTKDFLLDLWSKYVNDEKVASTSAKVNPFFEPPKQRGLIKRLWHDPVWSGVISGILLGVGGLIFWALMRGESIEFWKGQKQLPEIKFSNEELIFRNSMIGKCKKAQDVKKLYAIARELPTGDQQDSEFARLVLEAVCINDERLALEIYTAITNPGQRDIASKCVVDKYMNDKKYDDAGRWVRKLSNSQDRDWWTRRILEGTRTGG